MLECRTFFKIHFFKVLYAFCFIFSGLYIRHERIEGMFINLSELQSLLIVALLGFSLEMVVIVLGTIGICLIYAYLWIEAFWDQKKEAKKG